MANKTGEQMIQEALEQAKTQEYDPWKDMRDIYIPKRTRGEQSTIKVLINSRSYFVPLDTMTKVPLPVYNVLIGSMEMRKEMEKNAEESFGGSAVPML